ncbi:DegT/DnrJ/EryC1/StrS family aminotransferase [Andreprevotia chitinilytica]|uniref:DegT/DnrJ/EryC1/StrS family aminotransferase n=1 Tax=Andreprevotia chitinilytica TaxID=396808 RepID=UPI00055844A8|nr:DegT/DnrJ/EryC1/StrS family aminotransferase [Andreprevotia chitinilytica]
MVPFIDLNSQFKRIQSDVEERVLAVLRSGQYILGPEVAALEQQLAEFTGVKHAISCASGTDALMIALMAEGIGPGDAVFTTPFTFFATAEVIALLGATPIFVDIDPETFNIDPAALDKAITALKTGDTSCTALPKWSAEKLAVLKPRGIIAVDLFGLPADYGQINAVAERHGLFVLEDAAQGYGGKLNGLRAGALAKVACTSFFPAKPLGCYGDGGALFTDDDTLADLFRSIRVHGQGSDRYENVRLGITGRLDAIQAAVLIPKLAIFQDELDARQRVAATYNRLLAALDVELITPTVPNGYYSAWAQYSVLASNAAARQALMDKLKAAGIPTMIYYPKPLHLQKAFENLGHQPGDFPLSESVAERIFSLPMHPYLDDATIAQIVSAFK